jgi:thymidylate synthase
MIHHNMRNGFPLLTTKKVAFKTMATELMWFLKGDTNIKYLIDNGCNIWNGDAYKRYKDSRVGVGEPLLMDEFIEQIKTNGAFAEVWGDLGPIYGAQWRAWESNDLAGGTIDQIKHLIHQLKNNPDSRRLMVNAWNVDALEYMVLPPCHYGFQVYTRELSHDERINLCLQLKPESKFASQVETNEILMNDWNIPSRAISLSWNQRSIDVFLGLPFNIASYGLLLEMIAREVNMVPEHLIGNLGDTHLYLNHLEQAEQQLERIPRDLPIMKMSSGHNFRAAMAGKADEIDLDDFMLVGYNPHPTIKAPLSN